jgi:hypothetical protein
MPNWCECDLYVMGAKETVEAFLSRVKTEGRVFSFDRIIPYPDRFKMLDLAATEWERKHPEWRKTPGLDAGRPKDGFNQGGYEWCFANWGTKWDAARVRVGEAKEVGQENGEPCIRVKITFQTAWSPPTPVIRRASELFPSLRLVLRFFERGMAFSGTFVCSQGNVIRDTTRRYTGRRGG